MGGLYGNAAATALEDCPKRARGILSGMLQQGYAFGYLLATVFARGLVNTTKHGWRPLFWFGACPPVLIIIFRLLLPETQAHRDRQMARSEAGNIGKSFINEGKVALRKHWLLLIYLVLLMAGFNFMVNFNFIYFNFLNFLAGRLQSQPHANFPWQSPMAPKISTPRCSATNTAFRPTP